MAGKPHSEAILRPDTPARKRPASVTWLALLVFLLAGANLAAAAVIIARWSLYASLDLSVPLWASLGLGMLWGVSWLVTGAGLWRLWPWSRWATLILFPIYQLTQIGLPALFAQENYTRERLPIMATAVVLLYALIILMLMRPHIRLAFEPGADPTTVTGD
jgi:hypothetical protein